MLLLLVPPFVRPQGLREFVRLDGSVAPGVAWSGVDAAALQGGEQSGAVVDAASPTAAGAQQAGPYSTWIFFNGAAGVASGSYPGLSSAQAACVQ